MNSETMRMLHEHQNEVENWSGLHAVSLNENTYHHTKDPVVHPSIQ